PRATGLAQTRRQPSSAALPSSRNHAFQTSFSGSCPQCSTNLKACNYILQLSIGGAVRADDAEARRIWNDLADHLALGLSHAVHLVHPETLVLGGGLSLLGEPLRRAVETRLERLVMRAHRGTWKLRLASLGEQVVPAGALLLAAQRRAGVRRTRRLRRGPRFSRIR
ncbi:MAG: ROK family protein, partial [Verrucomicrobiae bacterium]|nr:ROK family protein [Verrucomicrobiae bacterium]